MPLYLEPHSMSKGAQVLLLTLEILGGPMLDAEGLYTAQPGASGV